MTTLPLFTVFVLLLSFPAVQTNTELYRWVDENGKTHFSNSPPNSDTATTKLLSDEDQKQTDQRVLNLQQRYPNQLDGSKPTHNIVVTGINLMWEPKNQTDRDRKRPIGRYFFGRG